MLRGGSGGRRQGQQKNKSSQCEKNPKENATVRCLEDNLYDFISDGLSKPAENRKLLVKII